MAWFSKKRNDFVDLTDMKKRGLLPEAKQEDVGTNSSGFVDLTSSSSNQVSSGINSKTEENTPNMDFLSNLASSSKEESQASVEQNSNYSSEESASSYRARLRAARSGESMQAQHLKTKIEDMEYKLERFIERLEKIESNLGI